MNIRGLDKAEILVALYNRARVHGLGFREYNGRSTLDYATAEQLLKSSKRFDYLNGKVLKIDLSGDTLDTFLYNRDNDNNAAEDAIQPLIEKLQQREKPAMTI